MKQLLINQYFQKLAPTRSTSMVTYQTESGIQKVKISEIKSIMSITSTPITNNEQLPNLISRNLINKYIRDRSLDGLPLIEPKSNTQYFINKDTAKKEFIERYVIKGHSINLKAQYLKELNSKKETINLNKSYLNRKKSAIEFNISNTVHGNKIQCTNSKRVSKSPTKEHTKKNSEELTLIKSKLCTSATPKHYALNKVKSYRRNTQSPTKTKKKISSALHRINEDDKQPTRINSKHIKNCLRQPATTIKKPNIIQENKEKNIKAYTVHKPKLNAISKKSEELPIVSIERLKQKSKPFFLPHDYDYTVRIKVISSFL